MALLSAANDETAKPRRRRLLSDFIFEVGDGGWETTIGRHVGVANEAEPEPEGECFGERFVLKDAVADDLPCHFHENFVLAGAEQVNLSYLSLLMKLFGAKFHEFPVPHTLGFGQRRFEEGPLQQFRMVEILGIAFQKREGREGGLLGLEVFGFLKIQQGADVVRMRRVNDDDVLASGQFLDQMHPLKHSEQQDAASDAEPNPGKPVALNKNARGVEA